MRRLGCPIFRIRSCGSVRRSVLVELSLQWCSLSYSAFAFRTNHLAFVADVTRSTDDMCLHYERATYIHTSTIHFHVDCDAACEASSQSRALHLCPHTWVCPSFLCTSTIIIFFYRKDSLLFGLKENIKYGKNFHNFNLLFWRIVQTSKFSALQIKNAA